jgi:hypothetical protein
MPKIAINAKKNAKTYQQNAHINDTVCPPAVRFEGHEFGTDFVGAGASFAL